MRSAGVEGPITSERKASEPERSHVWPQAAEPTGPHREGEEPKPMMHGHEKSDSAIVAMPPNKTGRPAAEAVERRAGAKENANRCRTCRTQGRASVSQAPERVRKAARPAVNIRGGSRMRESRTYGSVRGALSNGRPYRIRQIGQRFQGFVRGKASADGLSCFCSHAVRLRRAALGRRRGAGRCRLLIITIPCVDGSEPSRVNCYPGGSGSLAPAPRHQKRTGLYRLRPEGLE